MIKSNKAGKINKINETGRAVKPGRTGRAGKMVLLLAVILLLNAACAGTKSIELPPDVAGASIDRYPAAIGAKRFKLESFPLYDKYSSEPLEIDLRNYDITLLNLSDQYDALLRADFDTRTVWPYSLPEDVNPKEILETGKSPGPGVRQLHEEGVTGRGVGIAVIASPPLVEHSEYAGRIKLYKEMGSEDGNTVIIKSPVEANGTAGSYNADNPEGAASAGPLSASYVGTAIASIIAGRTTGVAPGAVLYYFSPASELSGSNNSEADDSGTDNREERLSFVIAAFNGIRDLNDKLPPEDKIRAVVIENSLLTVTFTPENGNKLQSSLEHALESGMLILSDSVITKESQGYLARCLGRSPLSAPDRLESYGTGYEWETQFLTYNDNFETVKKGCLLVPGDSRTTASPTGVQDYVFNRIGGAGFASAYLAGLYALACQVNPAVTPEGFLKAAIDTGMEKTAEKYGLERTMKYILDPLKLIRSTAIRKR